MKYRSNISDLIKEQDYKVIVEVGVARAGFANLILTNCSGLAISYTVVDPWTGGFAEFRPGSEEVARERLLKHPNCQIMKMTSAEAALKFEDQTVDLVYIDGAHDEASVKQDIDLWWPKLKIGGTLCGHDYPACGGVVAAVDQFAAKSGHTFSLTEIEYGPAGYADQELGGEEANSSSFVFEFKKA